MHLRCTISVMGCILFENGFPQLGLAIQKTWHHYSSIAARLSLKLVPTGKMMSPMATSAWL